MRASVRLRSRHLRTRQRRRLRSWLWEIPIDLFLQTKVLETLVEYGASAEVIATARRYARRYVAGIYLIVLGLIVITLSLFVHPIVGTLISLQISTRVAVPLFLSGYGLLIIALILRQMVFNTPYDIINATIGVISQLQRLRQETTPPKRFLGWSKIRRERRKTRTMLRKRALYITSAIVVLAGRRKRERDWSAAALLGRWLCWAAEDLDDKRRVDGALFACTDVVCHYVGKQPWKPPPTLYPPPQARLPRSRWSNFISKVESRLTFMVPAVAALLAATLPVVAKSTE